MQIKIYITNEIVAYDPKDKLTKENVMERLEMEFEKAALTADFLMTLSFYMDFAISTKYIALIDQVHNRIKLYVLARYGDSLLRKH